MISLRYINNVRILYDRSINWLSGCWYWMGSYLDACASDLDYFLLRYKNGIYVPSTVLALKIAKILKCKVEDIFKLP